MQRAISFKQENLDETLDDIVYVRNGKVFAVKIVLTRFMKEDFSSDNHGDVAKTFSRQPDGYFDQGYQCGGYSRNMIEPARESCMSPFPKVYIVYVALNSHETYLMFGILRFMQNKREASKVEDLTKMYISRFNDRRTVAALGYQSQKIVKARSKIGKICTYICQGMNKSTPHANSKVRKKVGRRIVKPRTNGDESTKGNIAFAKPSHVPVQKGGYRYIYGLLVTYIMYLMMVEVNGSGGRAATQNLMCYASKMEGSRIEELDKDAICRIPELTSTLKEDRNSICPFDDKTINLLAQMNGNYSCKNGYETKCFDGEDRLHFVCFPADIRCPKGFGWNISFNTGIENIEIILRKCKPGHYQETPSKCFDACKDEHFQPRHIPQGLKIYKDGDNINPQLLMCDFSSGYYNPENKSYIKADSEFTQNFIGFCVDSPNPCSEGHMVLHDGSCVERCENGYRRDAPDFTCKEKNYKKDSSVVRGIDDNIPSSFSLESGPSPPPTATTIGPHYAIIDNKKTVTTGILFILGCLFIVVACGVLFLLYKRQGVKPSHYTAEHEHELHDMRPMIGNANGTDETVVHVATENDLGDVTHHNTPLLQD